MYSERELQEKIVAKIKETISVDTERVRQEHAKEIELKLRKEFGWGDKRVSRLMEVSK